jgi:N-acetylneuraminic acid mutarotase
MNYYRCCGGSEKVTIDGEKVKDKLELQSYMFSAVKVDDQTHANDNFNAVVYDGEIHLIGDYFQHYKWDGTSWTRLSQLQIDASGSRVVVYNNEMHVLGSYNHNSGKYVGTHYKWDGTSWTQLDDIPYHSYGTGTRLFLCVVFNNEIHLFNGSYTSDGSGYSLKQHYKWDGTSWTELTAPPFYEGVNHPVVYNNKIHVIGGRLSSNGSPVKHYEWDGTTWTELDDLPFNNYGVNFMYNNEIYSIGNTGTYKVCYKWDGTSWTQLSDLPFKIARRGGSVVVYNNEIHMISNSENGEHLVWLVPFYVSLPYNVFGVYLQTT